MRSAIIGLNLKDKQFQSALAKGLAGCSKGVKIIEAGTEDYNSFEMKEICEDLILGDCFTLTHDYSADSMSKLIELVATTGEENIYNQDEPYKIYAYKGSKSIYNDLLFLYYKIYGVPLEFEKLHNSSLIAFTSASGGTGVTSIALETARQLVSYYDKSVMYINLQPLNSSLNYIDCDAKRDIRELIYYLKREKDVSLESYFSVYEEVQILNDNKIPNALSLLDQEDGLKVLDYLDKSGIFDFIFIDVGTYISAMTRAVIIKSNAVLNICKEEAGTLALDGLLTQRIFPEDTIRIVNFAKDDKTISIEYRDSLVIYRRPESFSKIDGLIKLEKYSEFGAEIKKVVELLMGEKHGPGAGKNKRDIAGIPSNE